MSLPLNQFVGLFVACNHRSFVPCRFPSLFIRSVLVVVGSFVCSLLAIIVRSFICLLQSFVVAYHPCSFVRCLSSFARSVVATIAVRLLVRSLLL